MIDVFGGMVGGLGIFFVGMWLLTESLKALATRRLRLIAQRWTGNRLVGFAWGTAAATITQTRLRQYLRKYGGPDPTKSIP